MAPKAKGKWRRVLKAELMSSEESSAENDEVFVKPIPWRSTLVNNFFEELDNKCLEKKPAQANRQRKVRRLSVYPSTRNIPEALPTWAIKN